MGTSGGEAETLAASRLPRRYLKSGPHESRPRAEGREAPRAAPTAAPALQLRTHEAEAVPGGPSDAASAGGTDAWRESNRECPKLRPGTG